MTEKTSFFSLSLFNFQHLSVLPWQTKTPVFPITEASKRCCASRSTAFFFSFLFFLLFQLNHSDCSVDSSRINAAFIKQSLNMGNTTSEVASGVKAQINSGGQGPELYRFVDMKVRDQSRSSRPSTSLLGWRRTGRCHACCQSNERLHTDRCFDSRTHSEVSLQQRRRKTGKSTVTLSPSILSLDHDQRNCQTTKQYLQ